MKHNAIQRMLLRNTFFFKWANSSGRRKSATQMPHGVSGQRKGQMPQPQSCGDNFAQFLITANGERQVDVSRMKMRWLISLLNLLKVQSLFSCAVCFFLYVCHSFYIQYEANAAKFMFYLCFNFDFSVHQ